jgi:hypothetical protein
LTSFGGRPRPFRLGCFAAVARALVFAAVSFAPALFVMLFLEDFFVFLISWFLSPLDWFELSGTDILAFPKAS